MEGGAQLEEIRYLPFQTADKIRLAVAKAGTPQLGRSVQRGDGGFADLSSPQKKKKMNSWDVEKV
jgi:hypothetical protein